VVTISGDNSDSVGYLAGETVHVAVNGPNGYTAACDAVADSRGAWSCQVSLWGDETAVGADAYMATGLTSGVSQVGVFPDALPQSSVTVTANSAEVMGGSYIISRVLPDGTRVHSGGSTPQNFVVKPNTSFTIYNIQSPINNCPYIGANPYTGVS